MRIWIKPLYVHSIFFLLLIFFACKKETNPLSSGQSEEINRAPIGFKFPAHYEGKPTLYSIKIYEKGKNRIGSDMDRAKFFPVLPFIINMGGFVNPNLLVLDEYFENTTYKISLKDNYKLLLDDYWGPYPYRFSDNALFYPFNSSYYEVAAYGNYQGLHLFDHFVFLNGDYFRIYRTPAEITAKDVIEYMAIRGNDNINLSTSTLAIATYYTPMNLMKSPK